MNKNEALELVQQYISGWKQNNVQLMISPLAEDCVIVESHGPAYRGIEDMKRWFKLWIETQSKVLKWDILSCSYCENEAILFFEWDFSCVANAVEYEILGISKVKFSDQKINFIHEYRMTKPAYSWKGEELISE